MVRRDSGDLTDPLASAPMSEPVPAEPVLPHATPVTGFTVPPGLYAAEEPLISRDYNGWWSRGIAVVRSGWRQLVLIQAAGAVVSFGAAAVFGVLQITSLPPGALSPTPGSPSPDPNVAAGVLLRQLGFLLGAVAVAGFVGLLLTLTTVHLVVQIASGRRAEFGPAVRAALPRILPLLGWGLLAGLIMVAGACACVLPVFYFYAVFLVLGPVVMFERGGAVGRCFRLFHGNLGASVGRVATIVGLSIGVNLVGTVVNAVLSAVTGGPGAPQSTRVAVLLAGALLGAVLQGGLGVLTAPLTVLTYADERARIEPVRSADLIRALGLGPEDQISATVPT
jgi:hypothetical protein